MNITETKKAMDYHFLADYITDIFTTTLFDNGGTVTYDALDTDKQKAIRLDFFDRMKQKNIHITNDFTLYFQNLYPGSCLNSIFASYIQNSNVADMHEVEAQLNKLQDKKVTLIYLDDFGYPCVTHTRVLQASIKPYAQYSDSLYIAHLPKRKRTTYEVHFLPYQKLAIYEGWKPVEKAYTNITKYHAFDNRFLNDIINALGQPDAQY
ncbi:hypothetical protein P8825_14855 [Shouchella clausii]|uniref:hypothetical protein n=1 Tax=Shouchella clausii TaxID=79880 RepID=UPI002DBA3BEE|nr:hypothetical protein [Shouchella clausii]MEB5480843.1 hypothetical protein [Shouchella clausii]